MTPPVALILNPSSSVAETAAALMAESGIEAKLTVVLPDSDITEHARDLYQSGYRTLIAVGGDGTVRAVAAAILDTDAVLGILPAGTLNHFARDLGLPPGLAACIQVLKTGTARAVDAAEVNGHPFLNNSGLGVYPSMVTRREKRRRFGLHKWVAFFLACMATLRRFPFLDVQLAVEGKVFQRRTPFVFIGNNVYRTEPFHFGTRDFLAGGKLFLAVAQHRIGRLGLLRLAFKALFGQIRTERAFEIFEVKEVRISSRHKRVPVSLDGEVRLIETPLHYRSRPGALRVIAP